MRFTTRQVELMRMCVDFYQAQRDLDPTLRRELAEVFEELHADVAARRQKEAEDRFWDDAM